MKKSYLLSGIIVLGVVSIDAAQELTKKQLKQIKKIEKEKIDRQKELARPVVYKMIDPLRKKKDWPAIFSILDSMQGVINVNEYYEPTYGYSLLMEAISQDNLLAAKTLLEKYKANPNREVRSSEAKDDMAVGMTPLMYACRGTDAAMVKLLLMHGGNPYQKDAEGKDSFGYVAYYADWSRPIQDVLREFKK